MSAAALNVYQAIRNEGSQRNVIDAMQTRAELYEFLDYHAYEEKLNSCFPNLPANLEMTETDRTPFRNQEIRRAVRRNGGQYRHLQRWENGQ